MKTLKSPAAKSSQGEPTYTYTCQALIIAFLLFLSSGPVMANNESTAGAALTEIVSKIVTIMHANGHEMPNYRVTSGHTDVPITGPHEKYAFFGYVDKGWMFTHDSIVLRFYEAHNLPILGRIQIIEYLVTLHEAKSGAIKISLYMTEEKYLKPEIIAPSPFFEMHINHLGMK